MRALLRRLQATADTLASDPTNSRLASKLASQWQTFSTINSFYCALKADVCFPQIGAFFPGHEAQALALNAALVAAQGELGAIIAAGPGPGIKVG